MRRMLLGVLLVACGGDDPKTGPPPLPTSSVPAADAGHDAAPIDAGPQSTKWSGSLDKTDKVGFGGAPYCDYQVVLSNVKVDLVVANDRNLASGAVTWTVTENTVGTCQFAPQEPTQNSASVTSAVALPNGGFHLDLAPAPTNRPQTSLVLESTAGGLATLEWHRTDQPSPLDWRVRATVSLLRQ